MAYDGKILYNPSGKAKEFSYWAANLYVGCECRCKYCFNRKGRFSKVLGADKPTLKKSLGNPEKAFGIFMKEVNENIDQVKEHGIFFNFVSDPGQKDTIQLNIQCILFCMLREVPVKILSKKSWWILEDNWQNLFLEYKHLIAFGWTLTGRDDLEPGADLNVTRILAAKKVHELGFKTFASIEPVIDFPSSAKMIGESRGFIDLYKIGLESGKKYILCEALSFYEDTSSFLQDDAKIYWKDSFLKLIGIDRCDLPENCVTREFNIWKG